MGDACLLVKISAGVEPVQRKPNCAILLRDSAGFLSLRIVFIQPEMTIRMDDLKPPWVRIYQAEISSKLQARQITFCGNVLQYP